MHREGAEKKSYIHLDRIEFVITDACTGRCKHCGNGERKGHGPGIDAMAAMQAVRALARGHNIESVMTFGGEPLLYAETVCKIHAEARACGIPERQLITNGCFSRDENKINEVAEALCASGVNDILLSVDCFHQEFIPIEPVLSFARALLRHGAPRFRVHPAWVVNEENDNPYNAETKRILKRFTDMGIESSRGNNIFPNGNAQRYLAAYFDPPGEIDLSLPCGSLPYTQRLDDVRCVCINPNGDVRLCSVGVGNIYQCGAQEIVEGYDPYADSATRAVMTGGVAALLCYAKEKGVAVETSDCRSACGVCRAAMTALAAPPTR